MGARALMSTLSGRVVRKIPSIEQISVFSVKLSSLMTNSLHEARIGPSPAPERAERAAAAPAPPALPREIGGREGPEPTRFGDWELRGRCIDF